MKKTILIIVLVLLSISIAKSQNLNFSQYYYTPTITNPAMIGSDGYLKAALHYRQQRTATGQGFRTPMLYAIYPFFNKKTGNRWGAVGLTVLNDQEGDFLNTAGGALTFSYNLSTGDIGKYRTNLSVGTQVGYYSRNVDASNVITPNQISNGTVDASVGTGEDLNSTNTSFLTASAGLYWYANDALQQPVFFLGISGNNLNEPNIAVLEDNQDPLFRRVNLIGGYRIWYNGTFSVMPTFQLENINSNNDFRGGSWFRYHLKNYNFISSGSLGIGAWYNNNQSFVTTLEFLQRNYFLNFAFEFASSSNLNALQGASPEITIGYRKSLTPLDTDQDGVMDKKDECPTIFGLPAFDGCPDTDGDGIQDSEDACPAIAGLPVFEGCPDTDGDGIQDSKDVCPAIAGLLEFGGCPDTDGDGIRDSEDACPAIVGLPAFDGCPDTDGDGIPDNLDACPLQRGRMELNGCEGFTEKEKLDLDSLLELISTRNFEREEENLPSELYNDLEQLVIILENHPEVTVIIEGHADSVGTKEDNLQLSQARADEAKEYLLSQNLKNKIIAKGYGSLSPIENNDTKEGRTLNRRIEIKVRYEE